MSKIIMFGRSIADIDKSLMQDFDITCQVVNFAAWIREKAYEDFGLRLVSSEAINRLDEIVVENHYRDKAEWLREKMREAIRAKRPMKQIRDDENDI